MNKTKVVVWVLVAGFILSIIAMGVAKAMPITYQDGDRIITISGKCSDLFFAQYKSKEHQGYVPSGLGCSDDSDYIGMKYCLECGQIQDDFPKEEPEFFGPKEW